MSNHGGGKVMVELWIECTKRRVLACLCWTTRKNSHETFKKKRKKRNPKGNGEAVCSLNEGEEVICFFTMAFLDLG